MKWSEAGLSNALNKSFKIKIMRSAFIPLLAGLAFFCPQMPLHAQEFKEHISKEFSLQKDASVSTVAVYNLFGSVKVEGYSGDKVMIEIDKTITADDNQ